MSEISDLLFDYALGHLSPTEHARVESALTGSVALQEELRELQIALGVLAEASPVIRPSPQHRARLLDSLEAPPVSARAYRALEEVFDLGSRAVAQVLLLLEKAEGWTESGVPGFSFAHFAGGPRTAGLECGLIRLSAGFEFPRHRHQGEEITLVVRGAYTDLSSGQIYRAGDISKMAAGTEHGFRVHPESDLVYAILMVPDAVEIFWPTP